jgi:catechol 2,3-dioxygenase-like lactoylglutathione lyase family enzyme
MSFDADGSLMISHLSIGVSDLERATSFYDAVLAPLGYVRMFSGPRSVGYGPPDGPEGLILQARPQADIGVDAGFHLAFVASNHEAVAQFHAAALHHGGSDNGRPGFRPDYGAAYYAAFAMDLDGHRLEAVCE